MAETVDQSPSARGNMTGEGEEDALLMAESSKQDCSLMIEIMEENDNEQVKTFEKRVKLSIFAHGHFSLDHHELMLSKDDFPWITTGDIVEIHYPDETDKKPRVLLKVKKGILKKLTKFYLIDRFFSTRLRKTQFTPKMVSASLLTKRLCTLKKPLRMGLAYRTFKTSLFAKSAKTLPNWTPPS